MRNRLHISQTLHLKNIASRQTTYLFIWKKKRDRSFEIEEY